MSEINILDVVNYLNSYEKDHKLQKDALGLHICECFMCGNENARCNEKEDIFFCVRCNFDGSAFEIIEHKYILLNYKGFDITQEMKDHIFDEILFVFHQIYPDYVFPDDLFIIKYIKYWIGIKIDDHKYKFHTLLGHIYLEYYDKINEMEKRYYK